MLSSVMHYHYQGKQGVRRCCMYMTSLDVKGQLPASGLGQRQQQQGPQEEHGQQEEQQQQVQEQEQKEEQLWVMWGCKETLHSLCRWLQEHWGWHEQHHKQQQRPQPLPSYRSHDFHHHQQQQQQRHQQQ